MLYFHYQKNVQLSNQYIIANKYERGDTYEFNI